MRHLAMMALLASIALSALGCAWGLGTIEVSDIYQGEGAHERRTVQVNGVVKKQVAPDEVNWNIQLIDQNPALAAAKTSNDEKVRRVLDLIQSMGVESADMQTSRFSIDKIYERQQYGNQGALRYYQVSRTVNFTLKDLKRYDEFLTQLIERADAEVSYSFDISTRDQIVKRMRLAAVEEAQEKARLMAERADMELGPAIHLIEQQDFSQPMISNRMMRMEADMAGGGGPTLAEGSIEVSATVNATFELLKPDKDDKKKKDRD